MKKILLVAAVLAFASCAVVDNSVKNTGTAFVQNGKAETDTVDYTCVGCEELLDKTSFERVVAKSTEETKNLMKNPRSFIPLKMEITVEKKDSLYHYDTNKKMNGVLQVITKYYYAAQNAYGTELEGDTHVAFYTDTLGNVQNIENLIKQPALQKRGEGVSRGLMLSDDEDFIKIDINEKDLLVTSSHSCVDTGTALSLRLDNEEVVRLRSWNSFNCDGYSFFRWFTPAQIELLKAHKVRFVLVTDDESVACQVPENEQDYFMQLMNLYE